MNTNFKIHSIPKKTLDFLFEMDEKQLARMGGVKQIADSKPGFPCRVSLQDAEVGEELILFPFRHHNTDSPYQSVGPIYIRKLAENPDLGVNELPQMLLHRHLSLRAYDEKGMMRKALTSAGEDLSEQIQILFSHSEIQYIHIHNAGPGCFNCEVRRSS